MSDLISIIIPTYNGEKYIKDCIKSIQNQNMNTEIIVIDDISDDKTIEIAKSLNCRVIINKTRQGQIIAKNTGIKEAKGKYWLTIDQDDILAKNALKKLVYEIEKNNDNYIVMAKLKDFCSIDTPEQKKYCKTKPYYGILTGTTLFKTEIFNKIGFWKKGIITGDVIDLENRLINTEIKIKKIDFVSCYRRIHDNNYGKTNQKDEYKDYAKLLRERLKINKESYGK